MRQNRPTTMRLGVMQDRIDSRVESGAYASATEVMRAALRALDREEKALDELLRLKVEAALRDPRENIPAEEVFAALRLAPDAKLATGDA